MPVCTIKGKSNYSLLNKKIQNTTFDPFAHPHSYAFTHTHTHTNTPTHALTCTCMHTHTHTHALTITHTQSSASLNIDLHYPPLRSCKEEFSNSILVPSGSSSGFLFPKRLIFINSMPASFGFGLKLCAVALSSCTVTYCVTFCTNSRGSEVQVHYFL